MKYQNKVLKLLKNSKKKKKKNQKGKLEKIKMDCIRVNLKKSSQLFQVYLDLYGSVVYNGRNSSLFAMRP